MQLENNTSRGLRGVVRKSRTLVLYGLIGCLASGLDFVVYTLLVRFAEMPYWLANTASVTVGICTSFVLNRQYNFRVKDKTAQRFVTFAVVGLCGMALSNLILWFCIDRAGVDALLSKLLSIAPVVLLQFLINKCVTFKRTE